MPQARADGSGTRQYQFDAQGSVAQTLSGTGAVLDAWAYDAYGRELAVRTPVGIATMATDPFGFDARWGYYADRELGTYYCQSRNYDPGTARWLERDPIGLAGGVNPYAYCAANPVGRVDPSGLSFWGWGDDQWTGFSRWISGRDAVDPNGNPVRIGGWCRTFNKKGNYETVNGTVHAYDEDDFRWFSSNSPKARRRRDHEEGHIYGARVNGGRLISYLGCGVYGAMFDLMDKNRKNRVPSSDPLGHDYNPWEIWADLYADQKEGTYTPMYKPRSQWR